MPIPSAPAGPQDGSPWEEPDPALEAAPGSRSYRLLRGGSWIDDPHYCRAAFRDSNHPGDVDTVVGVRPCCLLPPGSLLGA